jgi:hypothetical protein
MSAAVSLGICHLQGRAGLEKNETLARACFEEVSFNQQKPPTVNLQIRESETLARACFGGELRSNQQTLSTVARTSVESEHGACCCPEMCVRENKPRPLKIKP